MKGELIMSNRSAESISKEISEKMVIRSELINQAKEIVLNEVKKSDSYFYIPNENDNSLLFKGLKYGKAVLDLDAWFSDIDESYPLDKLARDMMNDIKQQLVPKKVISM